MSVLYWNGFITLSYCLNIVKHLSRLHRFDKNSGLLKHQTCFYLILVLSLSGNSIIFNFSFCIHLNSQGIRGHLLSTHLQWKLGHMDLWESSSIPKVLQRQIS